MAEPFRLGRPAETGEKMEPNVRAIRALVGGMNRIEAEVTEDLVAGLAVIVANWPETSRDPSDPTQNGSPTPASASSSASEGASMPHSASNRTP